MPRRFFPSRSRLHRARLAAAEGELVAALLAAVVLTALAFLTSAGPAGLDRADLLVAALLLASGTALVFLGGRLRRPPTSGS